VTSYKRQTVNGIENGVQENVGYSSTVSGDGFSFSDTSVSAEQNNTLSARNGSVTFTQSESGKKASVALSQTAGVEGWNYTFDTPTPSKNVSDAGMDDVTINSYRIRTINGNEVGTREQLTFSAEITKNFNEREPLTYIEVQNNNLIYIEYDMRDMYTGDTAEIMATQSISGKILRITFVYNG